MTLKLSLATLALTSLTAAAVTINVGSTGDGGLDGTDVDNWTTNNTVYDGSNGGLAFEWENVTATTATVDSGNNEFDFVMTSTTNHTIGHGYLFNEGLDLSTTTGGLTGMTIGFDFNGSANTNWSPVIAITNGGSTDLYRWNHSSNSFNGNGTLFGNTFLQNATLNSTNSTWGLLNATSGDWGGTRTGGTNPDLQATTGTVQFGFIQWGAGTGGAANITGGTLAFDQIEWEVSYDAVPEPASAALLGLGGLALLRRRRK